MFNRGNPAAGPLSVEISLADGRKLKGKFVVPQGRTLPEILNAASPFIEFEAIGAQRTFVAKSILQTVTPLNVAPAPSLAQQSDRTFDPYAVLGVTPRPIMRKCAKPISSLPRSTTPTATR